jgi:hypothetical protein
MKEAKHYNQNKILNLSFLIYYTSLLNQRLKTLFNERKIYNAKVVFFENIIKLSIIIFILVLVVFRYG